MKRMISILMLFLIAFASSNVAYAYAATKPVENLPAVEDDVCIGSDLVLENVTHLDNGFIIITEVVNDDKRVSAADEVKGQPEVKKSKTFIHRIYYSGGNTEMARLTSTVVGMYYPSGAGTAYLTSISGVFSGAQASHFSCSTNISGNTGSISMYYYGAFAGIFGYKINNNGTIVQV